ERLAIGQIAVVRERDAERRIDVERLRFELRRRGARGGITAMADAGVARKLAHVARAEDVAHVTRRLVHVKYRALAGHDAGRVLTPVLQQQQAVIQELVNRRMRNGADDSTHKLLPSSQTTAVHLRLSPPAWTPGFAGRPGLAPPGP